MPSSLTMTSSCFFIPEHGCYEVLKDFSGAIVTFLIFSLGFGITYYKLSKQHRDTLKQQDEEFKKRFKIELFNEFKSFFDLIHIEINDVCTFCRLSLHPVTIKMEEPNTVKYEKFRLKLGEALVAVILRIETREIVHPLLFQTFRYALQSLVHDIMELNYNKNIAETLPKLLTIGEDASCYLGDFQICLQNMTWGKVFDTKIKQRDPINNKLKVIVDNIDALTQLKQYFRDETEWGIHNKKIEQSVRDKFSQQENVIPEK